MRGRLTADKYQRATWLARELRDYVRSNGLEAPALSTTEHVSRYLGYVFERIVEATRGRAHLIPENAITLFGMEELRLLHAAVHAGRDREPFVDAYGATHSCSREQLLASITEQFTRLPRHLDAFLLHESPEWVDEQGRLELMERREQEEEEEYWRR